MNSKFFFLLSALLLVTAEAYHGKFHLLPYGPMRLLFTLILKAMVGSACLLSDSDSYLSRLLNFAATNKNSKLYARLYLKLFCFSMASVASVLMIIALIRSFSLSSN